MIFLLKGDGGGEGNIKVGVQEDLFCYFFLGFCNCWQGSFFLFFLTFFTIDLQHSLYNIIYNIIYIDQLKYLQLK